MEVYNSSYTAKQLEYALGAVPSIGENGNWYIGDQDTGVFAGGVDVSGAEVGQFVKIASVDSNGRPTSWTPFMTKALTLTGAVEASYDGSESLSVEIPNIEAWELIRDVTLEEAVSCSVVVSEKENGESFNYRKVCMILITGSDYNIVGWTYLGVNGTGSGIWAGQKYVSAYFGPGASTTWLFTPGAYLAEGGILSSHILCSDKSSKLGFVHTESTMMVSEITRVTFCVNGTIPAGTRIIFYGTK